MYSIVAAPCLPSQQQKVSLHSQRGVGSVCNGFVIPFGIKDLDNLLRMVQLKHQNVTGNEKVVCFRILQCWNMARVHQSLNHDRLSGLDKRSYFYVQFLHAYYFRSNGTHLSHTKITHERPRSCACVSGRFAGVITMMRYTAGLPHRHFNASTLTDFLSCNRDSRLFLYPMHRRLRMGWRFQRAHRQLDGCMPPIKFLRANRVRSRRFLVSCRGECVDSLRGPWRGCLVVPLCTDVPLPCYRVLNFGIRLDVAPVLVHPGPFA